MMKTHDEIPYWLALNRCSKVGGKRLQSLLANDPILSHWFVGRQPNQALNHWYQSFAHQPIAIDWSGVEKDLEWLKRDHHHLLFLNDEDYPQPLKQIASPPLVLFVAGDVSLLNAPQIALVGSRRPTQEGAHNAHRFAKQLALWGMVITSGLALGVDAAGHQGAVEATGQTIAVLGHGLDTIYPRSHQALAQAIKERGALVSEFPIGFGPRREHFPRRNRIISGLSLGTIIIEAAKKSGSLITADYALDQGREIFALPGSINNPMAEGCHQLIRQGALCIDSPTQVMETLRPQLTEAYWDASITQVAENSYKTNLPTNPRPKKEEIHSQLGPTEAKILALVSDNCTPLDGIVDQSGLTSQQVSMMLLNLELLGRIKTVPGGVVRL